MKKWLNPLFIAKIIKKRIGDPLATAWTGVITHKLRSFLTILGIVIGVGAVITLMSVGRGAEADIISRFESLGSDLITVRPGAFTFGGVRGGMSQTLTMEDSDAIAAQVDNIRAVAPTYSSSMQVVVGGSNTNSSVTGVTPAYWDVQNLEIASGSFFGENEFQRGSKVAIIGSTVKEDLFGTAEAVGQRMRMGGLIVTVIGVLDSKGGMPGGSPDDSIYIPLTAMQQAVAQPRTAQGGQVVSTISLSVTDEDLAPTVVEDITALLRERHRLGAGVDDDFNIMSMEEIASNVSEAIGTMTLLLGAIAAISLLVGGIGVMNIMLVSVLERTREIGIRKALGAHEWDILSQFIIEAAFLSLAGGIVGVIFGWGVSFIVDRMGVMSTVVTPDIVLMAVGVSVGIGLFFGSYPAWNASRLNPIEALRSD